ncbi:MAG TPA: hypothetical protein DIT92_01450 [Anaerovibrio sp.]|nr:hypothetical protein [Anaerovibrio sp.]
MSSIKIQLSDHRAIKDADVAVSSITVMAGPNGSGKSTVSQMLNGLINGINNFEQDMMADLLKSFKRELTRIRRAIPDSDPMRSLISSFDNHNDEYEPLEQIRKGIDGLYRVLIDYAEREVGGEELKRRLDYIIGEETLFSNGIEGRIADYSDMLYKKYESLFFDKQQKLRERRVSDLFLSVVANYSSLGNIPTSVTLWEDNHPVVEGTNFSDLLSVRKSIYINTSTSVVSPGFDMSSYRLKNLVVSDLPAAFDEATGKILKELSFVIGGEIYLDNEIGSFLKFKSRSGVNIYLEDAASGIQSLAVLYRLLYAGLLDNETVLILDEPESHLHPQWIVELAKILVKINKNVGTKILIASHCPDLVSALYNLAKVYDVEDIRFYQTYQDGNGSQYTFKDCGGEISDIFESFNIALERISCYGRMVQER